MDKSSVAKLVFKLIELGYVERTINPEDRRQYMLRLTKDGNEKTKEFLDLLSSWEKDVFGNMGTAGYEECMRQMTMALEAAEKKNKSQKN